MSQCVPDWEDFHSSPRPPQTIPPSKTTITTPHPHSPGGVPPNLYMLDYDVAELTWENGQLAMHGLGLPRIHNNKTTTTTTIATSNNKQTWDHDQNKQQLVHAASTGSGTLESIVNQAAHLQLPIIKYPFAAHQDHQYYNNNPQGVWFDHQPTTTTATNSTTMDALVPSSNCGRSKDDYTSTLVPKLTTRVDDNDEIFNKKNNNNIKLTPQKRKREAAAIIVPVAHAGSTSLNPSVTASVNSVKGSWQATLDTYDIGPFASGSGSLGLSNSPDNTTSGKPSPSYTKPIAISTDHDSDNSQSRPIQDYHQKKHGVIEGNSKIRKLDSGKSSAVSTRRSRAAAIHNQSERKRRDKINQRMKTLQKLVPNSSKTDKASMLDEVIEYIKQLQAQVQTVNCRVPPMSIHPNMNMNMMMPPIAMQQHLQMSAAALMAQMGMGMGMGMSMGMGPTGVLDLNPMGNCHQYTANVGISPPFIHPSAAAAASAVLTDPAAMSAFLANCQQSQQQMTMETYSRMAAALYHQQQNQSQTLPVMPNSKN